MDIPKAVWWDGNATEGVLRLVDQTRLPGEHVVILPDLEAHFEVARAYLVRFLPDVNLRPGEAVGRWPYVTIVGDTSGVSADAGAGTARSP